jgi:hypothetical protein
MHDTQCDTCVTVTQVLMQLSLRSLLTQPVFHVIPIIYSIYLRMLQGIFFLRSLRRLQQT